MRIFLVGIGNPGPIYTFTRHNIGQLFIDFVAVTFGVKFQPGKGEYVFAKRGDLFLFKSLTYMNLSGTAVKEIVDDFGVDVSQELFVCHDDLDMEPFSVKVKYDGGSGGHRGIESCIFHLETLDFYRIKFGIGKPQTVDPKDYVLSQLSDDELNKFKDSFKIALEGILKMLNEGRDKGITFINTYGRKINNG